MTERIHPALPSRPPRVRRWAALWLVPTLLVGTASAEPFVVEAMPAGFDGVVLSDVMAVHPQAIDFNGDGEPSWYAGGRMVAHPKQPTPLDPERYLSVALPAIASPPECSGCAPIYLAFATGDLNRDGHPDIVRLNQWTGVWRYTLQVFLGSGDNSFTLGDRRDYVHALTFNDGGTIAQLALGDFDRDGDPDLVELMVYNNINQDANPDRAEGHVRIRWNQANQLDTQTVLSSLNLPKSADVFVVDLERDGDLDVVVDRANLYGPDGSGIYGTFPFRFENDGSGGFTSVEVDVPQDALTLVDLNRDAWTDYLKVLHDGGLDTIHAFLNDQTGQFGAGSSFAPIEGGELERKVFALADFDEDGRLDFIRAEGTSAGIANRLVLRRGQANGSMGPGLLLATLPFNIVSIGSGDARGDADQDLVIRLLDGSFRLVRNTAQRLYSRAGQSVSALTVSGATHLETLDGNRDGVDDLFALRPAGPHIHRALGDGAGAFAAAETKSLAGTASDFTYGDFDRDGRTDLAYVVPASGDVHLVRQTNPLFAIWNDTTIANYPGAALVEAGQGALLDGTLDLAVASNTTGGLRWLRNIGGAVSWSATTPRASFAVTPTDLVLIPWFSVFGDTAVTCGDGSTTFSIDGYSNVLGWYRSISLVLGIIDPMPGVCFAANMDLDADLELVFQDTTGNLWFWNPNGTGTGPFSNLDASLSGSIQGYATTDWNRDGLDDLLVGTEFGLYLYTREGNAESWSRHQIQRNTNVLDLSVLDVDRDSRPDAAILTGTGVRWVRNTSETVEASNPALPPANPLTLQPNGYGDALDITITNPGRENEDASIAVTGTRIVFRHAVQVAGNWTMGAVMTPAEVQQAVSSVLLLVDGSLVGIAYANEVAADGSLQVDYNPAEGGAVPIIAGQSKSMKLRVVLKATAGSASYGSFYVNHPDWSGTSRVLHGNQPTGRTGTFGLPVLNRIVINNTLFGDGFETSP